MITIRRDDGATIAVHDFGGDGPDILFAHATGLHAHTWLPVVTRLRSRFRCVGFDQRGHGDSPTPPAGRFSWVESGADARAVIAELGLRHPFGVGHSGGGAMLVLAEQQAPGSFRALWLFEPVLPAPGWFGPPAQARENPMATAARRRREVFASREEARTNYAGKPPFNAVSAEGLGAYVDHGFDDLPDGTVRLKCRAEDEARTFEAALDSHAFDGLGEVLCPVTIAAGGATDSFPPAFYELHMDRLPHGRLEAMTSLGHFGPIEDPDVIAAAIVRAFTAA